MRPHLRKTENLAPLIPDRAALHEIACTYAEDRFRHLGRCDATWLVAIGPQVAWVETPFEGTGEKRAATYMMREMLKATGAQAYSYITEAYVAAIAGMPKADRKRWLRFANEHGVAALPEHLREDVLIIMTHDRKGGASSITRYLVTIRQGKGPNFLGPRVDEGEQTGYAGPMFNLFAPEQPMEFEDGD